MDRWMIDRQMVVVVSWGERDIGRNERMKGQNGKKRKAG